REKRAIELEQERDKRRLQARHERQDKALRKQREREQRYMRERHKLQQKELQNQRNIERKSLESQRQKEQKSLQMAQDRRRKDLENERKAFQKSLQESRKKAQTETRLAQESARKQHEAKRRALEIELRELKAFTPRNREELNDHMGKVRRAYDKYGVDLKAKGNSWSKYVGNRFTENLRVAGQDLKNKINWDNIGASIAAKLIGGSFGMRPREFAQWIVNGKVPKGGISGVTTGGAAGTRGRNQIARHTGGAVFDGRSGIP